MTSLISGEDNCKTFTDGTKVKPSYVCYALVFLIVVGVVTNLVHVGEYPAFALSQASLGAGLTYVMYENCKKCNGWRGFLLVVAIGIVVGIVLQAIPMHRPPTTTSSAKTTTCPQGGCDQERAATEPSCVGVGCVELPGSN